MDTSLNAHGLTQWHGTTIIGVKRGDKIVVAGDGQVSMGNTVMKPNAKKVRRIGEGKVVAGFAGATADAFTLFERLERKLDQYSGQLMRAAVELAKDWRTDKYLRNLEALMIVADKETLLVLTGNGDVLEPEGGIAAIGSGGELCPRCCARPFRLRRRCRTDRPQGHGRRGRNMRFHQRQRHARNRLICRHPSERWDLLPLVKRPIDRDPSVRWDDESK